MQKKIIQKKKKKDFILIDLNNASDSELSKLPGINIVLAKKIVFQRENEGEYSSFEDFIKRMNIKPHFAKKIKNLVKIEKMKTIPKNENKRMLDI